MSRLPLILAAGASNPRLQWAALAMRAVLPLASSVTQFFHLMNRWVIGVALSEAAFFFALAAIFYIASGFTGNERARSHATEALWAALAGLVLALLSNVITNVFSSAANGQDPGAT
jgi:hypothetical protein